VGGCRDSLHRGVQLALFAEALVEEWLNRKGYFTIRGVKVGNSEIDLLAVSPSESKGLHVEVGVSTNSIGYLCSGSAKKLSPQELEACTERWVLKKYSAKEKKVALQREALWPGRDWGFMLVHGDMKYPQELEFISRQGVRIVHIRNVLTELRNHKQAPFRTSSEATAVAELLGLYCSDEQS
jgi:hypothetical protein